MPHRTLGDLAAQLEDLPPGAKLYVPVVLVERLFPPGYAGGRPPEGLEQFADSHGCTVAEGMGEGSMPRFTKALEERLR